MMGWNKVYLVNCHRNSFEIAQDLAGRSDGQLRIIDNINNEILFMR